MKKLLLTITAVMTLTAAQAQITESKGWLESAYAKWQPTEGATSYNVYIKGEAYADFTRIDPQLVRDYGTYGRADMVGLKAGSYQMKVVPVNAQGEMTAQAMTTGTLEVKGYDRAGYAHFNNAAGIGAYNNDGTLKSGAKVLYVTKQNFNTVTLELTTNAQKGTKQTFTGLGNILEGKKKGTDSTPIAVRIVGEITYASTDKDQRKSDEDGLQLKGDSKETEMNVTLEGIGDDATLNGFGMTFYNGTGVEMRNLAIINFKDDGVQLKGTQHAWIHHNDLFYGNAGSDADQAKGDGSMDVKDDSRYCTFSYNHFWDSGKTSLCGMKSESGPNYLCYHHNWFDHSDSRHPRVRTMSVHVWNNYYDGVSKIGVGAVKGANIFVESNYFRNSKNPMLISEQGTDGRNGFADDHDGGMIKAYGNILTGKSLTTFRPHTVDATEFDAYVAEQREEKVPESYKSVVGGYVYSNFDTDASLMYDYTPDAAADVPAIVTGQYGAGRMNHGDLQWTFTESDDTKDAIDQALKTKVTSYRSSLVGIYGEDAIDDNPGEDNPGEDTPTPTPIEGTILCTFDKSGTPSSELFTVNGNGSNSKGTATVDGQTLSTCLKLESSTSVKFTLTQSMTLTLYFADTETANIKIDGTKVTGSASTYTTTLTAGSHELTKADSRNLFAIKLAPTATALRIIRTSTNSGKTYNLNGQQASATKKGVYIVNGKTAVVK
ncbi:MAG: pectate lyase [Prevotella sp.]|nr:pectate lyase [Prevotella sp.]